MRPLMKTTDVTSEMASPLIPAAGKGTDLYGTGGFYESEKRRLAAIHIYSDGEPAAPPDRFRTTQPLILVAVPTIDGRPGRVPGKLK